MTRSLVVRLDSLGDMLVSGPAIRAVAAASSSTTVLAGPAGADAARLLPGVDDVLVWNCPWIAADPAPVRRPEVAALIDRLAGRRFDRAVLLTSFHQSALPTALLLRLAGIGHLTAISEDYPGSLLDVRLPSPPDAPEPERMLAVARGAGCELPPGDDGRLRVRVPARHVADYVVVHPGASAPARAYPAAAWRRVVELLAAAGRTVLVTGTRAEAALTAYVAGDAGLDRAGRYDLAEFATVLAGAAVLAVGNTGPAHLAAAVGTPVVSLFAPVVPAARWAPYGVPSRLLGDQAAACRDSRARTCPVPGHPCLARVPAEHVVAAVDELAMAPVLAGEPR